MAPDRDQQHPCFVVDIVDERFRWIIYSISSENLSLAGNLNLVTIDG